MKWQIRGANGWRDNEWYTSRKAALDGIKTMRREFPERTTYKLVRRSKVKERTSMKFECEVKLDHTEKFRSPGYVRVWMRRADEEGYGEHEYDVGHAIKWAYESLLDRLIAKIP